MYLVSGKPGLHQYSFRMHVSLVLSFPPRPLPFDQDWVDIIKGKEEAGLAWIAANYLQGTFQARSELVRFGPVGS